MNSLRRSSYGCIFASVIGFSILYIPILILILHSFWGGFADNRFSFESYIKLFGNEKILNSIYTSLGIALCSSTISVIVGGLAAMGFDQIPKRARFLLRIVTYAPLILPEIVFGLGLLVWFVCLKISLGYTSLIIAHVTFSVSYVLLTVLGRVQTLDPSITEAARDLGASPWQVFWNVKLPLLMPAFVSGWMMAFTLSFDDFLISFFTSGPETVTLPLALYSTIKFGVTPEIFAMSSCIFGVSFLGALFVRKVSE